MRFTFQKKDGTKFETWYRDAIKELEIVENVANSRKNPCVEVDFKDPNSEFKYQGETFRFQDYCAPTVDELISMVDEAQKEAKRTHSKPWVNSDEALATFIKYTDKIGILMPMECYTTVSPLFGIALKGTGSKIANSLMVPFEDRYKKINWSYKIDLKAYDEARYGQYIGREHSYFSDFWDNIVSGRYKLVNLDEYCKYPENIMFELTGEVVK